MWMLSNDTPFAAERTLTCNKDGSDVWVVAVKATFLIEPDGTTIVADEQAGVVPAPQHSGDPLTSSLIYETDLDYAKPGTDILLHGHAYAPNGAAATQVDVTMKVDRSAKTLRVFGDRVWTRGILGLAMSDPEPFRKMPLVYERAFGGTDTTASNPKNHGWERRNPVGAGFATDAEHLVNRAVPNVEDPRALISSWRDRPRPAGFGPIARHWSPRVELAGTYDEKWQEERLPLLPLDFNERFFQCAPYDQQPREYLKGYEKVELHNLTPGAHLRFTLPRVALRLHTNLAGKTVTQKPNLHTVILEPDFPRVIMVWHSMLPCHGKKLKLLGTTVARKEILNPVAEAADAD